MKYKLFEEHNEEIDFYSMDNRRKLVVLYTARSILKISDSKERRERYNAIANKYGYHYPDTPTLEYMQHKGYSIYHSKKKVHKYIEEVERDIDKLKNGTKPYDIAIGDEVSYKGYSATVIDVYEGGEYIIEIFPGPNSKQFRVTQNDLDYTNKK